MRFHPLNSTDCELKSDNASKPSHSPQYLVLNPYRPWVDRLEHAVWSKNTIWRPDASVDNATSTVLPDCNTFFIDLLISHYMLTLHFWSVFQRERKLSEW